MDQREGNNSSDIAAQDVTATISKRWLKACGSEDLRLEPFVEPEATAIIFVTDQFQKGS